jgi:hypothetical protein
VILDMLLPASGTITPLGYFMWLGLVMIAIFATVSMVRKLVLMFNSRRT